MFQVSFPVDDRPTTFNENMRLKETKIRAQITVRYPKMSLGSAVGSDGRTGVQ